MYISELRDMQLIVNVTKEGKLEIAALAMQCHERTASTGGLADELNFHVVS